MGNTTGKGNQRRRRLTSVLFVKCEPDLYKRVTSAAELSGHNNISSFVRAAVIEKMLHLSTAFPALKDKNREEQAA